MHRRREPLNYKGFLHGLIRYYNRKTQTGYYGAVYRYLGFGWLNAGWWYFG